MGHPRGEPAYAPSFVFRLAKGLSLGGGGFRSHRQMRDLGETTETRPALARVPDDLGKTKNLSKDLAGGGGSVRFQNNVMIENVAPGA